MKKYSLKFLNFLTWYKSEGDVPLNMKKEVCFSHIFHMRPVGLEKKNIINNTYTIRVFYDGSCLEERYNNHCFLALGDIKRYLNQGKKHHPFKYTINKQNRFYDIVITVKGTVLAHKFILSYVRYLYETPFSLYLYEAVKLKKECEEFKKLNYLNIFNIIGASVPNYTNGTDIHAIGSTYTFKKLLTCEQIKQQLKNTDRFAKVNDIFPYIEDGALITIKNDFNDNSIWRLKSERKQRISTYLHNYNLLKNYTE